jgi:transposase
MTNQRRVRALTFRLNAQQRRRLSEQVKNAKNARSVRRAIALLELDQGRPVAEVAATFGVTRQTLYNWRARLEADDVPRALRDRRGRGRRSAWTEPVRRFLGWTMTLPPEDLGYASVGWTAALLLRHLERWAGMRVSDTTLREQLHRLGYVWKRPRYMLQPDPDREKKAPNPAADPRSAEGMRPACRGRNRREAVPTPSCGVDEARRAGQGLVERPQRAARDLRHHQPADRAPRTAVP